VIGKDYVAAVKQGEEIKDQRTINHDQWIVKVRMRDNGRTIEVRADRAQWEKLREKDQVKVTYRTENGGRWDHVAPPVRDDGWGTGTRVPTIIISPLARQGYIDQREYETVSILKLLEFRFNLAPLAARDADPAVSDLVDAFTQ
jgi:phospholipase C